MMITPPTKSSILPPPILVTDANQLQLCIQTLFDSEAIAVDTEFMRTDTFFPILGLVQIFNGDNCWLIDPLSIPDLTPLKNLLTNNDVLKVFHSCSEDIEVLKHVLGCIPQPIFDTQVAAAFVGYGFSKGYATLVNIILDVHVDKGETRSNWLQRPLSDSQLGYAALDVVYLLPVYIELKKKLLILERHKWVDEEMTSLVEMASVTEDLSLYFQKIKGAWQLSPEKLSALQLICEWREIEARKKNRPRGRIIDDKTILGVASKAPQSRKELSEIEGMYSALVQRYAEKFLDFINESLDRSSEDHPRALVEPLPRYANSMIKNLKKIIIAQADSLNLAPELLAKKKDVEFLVRCIINKEQIKLPNKIAYGWRLEAIGSLLLESSADLV